MHHHTWGESEAGLFFLFRVWEKLINTPDVHAHILSLTTPSHSIYSPPFTTLSVSTQYSLCKYSLSHLKLGLQCVDMVLKYSLGLIRVEDLKGDAGIWRVQQFGVLRPVDVLIYSQEVLVKLRVFTDSLLYAQPVPVIVLSVILYMLILWLRLAFHDTTFSSGYVSTVYVLVDNLAKKLSEIS